MARRDKAARAEYDRVYRKQWRAANPEKFAASQSRTNRKWRTGWDGGAWDARRAATGDCCEICGKHTTRPQADHNHKTMIPRGLLCTRCNTGLGFVERYLEDPAPTRAYLEKYDGPTTRDNLDR